MGRSQPDRRAVIPDFVVDGRCPMIIEAASPADAAPIAKIHRAARQAAMPWLPVLHTPEEDLRDFTTIVLPVETVLIAREGAEAVGFASVRHDLLNHLCIAPDHWGSGFGTRLLGAARTDRCYLQLRVFQGNARARRFHARHGFLERECTDGQANEEKMPDLRMDWSRGRSPGDAALEPSS